MSKQTPLVGIYMNKPQPSSLTPFGSVSNFGFMIEFQASQDPEDDEAVYLSEVGGKLTMFDLTADRLSKVLQVVNASVIFEALKFC